MTTCLASAKNNQRSIERPIAAKITAVRVSVNAIVGVKKVKFIRITGKMNKVISEILRNEKMYVMC